MNTIKAFLKERGLYLFCLALVFTATAAGIFALRSAVRGLVGNGPQLSLNEGENTWDQPDAIANNPVTDLPQPTSAPSARPSAVPSPSGASSQATAGQGASAPSAPASAPRPASPVDGGKPGTPFSADELIYHATLGDWRTHNGADYQASAGADVYAMASGEVSAVYADALWGTVVEVTGANGTQWRYCGLDAAGVQRGSHVTAGTLLGTLGSIPAEADAGAHLHLECLKNGQWVDPAL